MRPKEDSLLLPPAPAPERPRFSLRTFLTSLGPGLLVSLAYIDPGNLEADLQLGAYTALTQSWVVFWSTAVSLVLQELAARYGVVTGSNLAEAVREAYPVWVTWAFYLNMEIAVMGADLQEMLGAAMALRLLFGLPLWAGALVNAAFSVVTLAAHDAAGSRRWGGRVLHVVAGAGTFVTLGCLITNLALVGGVDVLEMLKGFVLPLTEPWGVAMAVGAVGANIMPHNLVLHSGALLGAREAGGWGGSAGQMRLALLYARVECFVLLLLTVAANEAVVATFSHFASADCAALGVAGGGEPLACLPRHDGFQPLASNVSRQSEEAACTLAPLPGIRAGAAGAAGNCASVGLEAAAGVLRSATGSSAATVLWAVALLSAGMASTVTTTYAGVMIMEGCLRITLPSWMRVAATRAVSVGPALAIALASGDDSDAAQQAIGWFNVLQAVQLPYAVVPTLLLASGAALGEHRPGVVWLALACLIAVGVMLANGVMAVLFFQRFEAFRTAWWPTAIIALVVVAQLAVFGRMCAARRAAT